MWWRSASCLLKEIMLKVHHYVRKCLLNQRSSVIRQMLVVVLGLLFVGITLIGTVVGVHAAGYTACSGGDHTHTVTFGDTLSRIASHNGTSWQVLAAHNHIANPNIIWPGQPICIPSAASVHSANSVAAVSANTAPQTGGNVTSMINQVFGSDASGALRVATCESSLNPGATNSISVGGSHAAGVFQILYPSTWAGTSQAANSPYSAQANILAAHEIFLRDGHSWREWVCQP